MSCGEVKLSKYLTQTFMAHYNAMICQQVTLSGDAEWPKVADAVIEAENFLLHISSRSSLRRETFADRYPSTTPAVTKGLQTNQLILLMDLRHHFFENSICSHPFFQGAWLGGVSGRITNFIAILQFWALNDYLHTR